MLRKVAIREQDVDDSSVRVMPVNWTPNQGRPNGVEDIEDQNRKANIFRQYDADLRLKLEFEFSVEKLYNDLKKNGHELRRCISLASFLGIIKPFSEMTSDRKSSTARRTILYISRSHYRTKIILGTLTR